MDTDSYIVYIKTEDIYSDITKEVETRLDTSNCALDQPLPIEKNKRVIRLMKNEFGGKIMTEFASLSPKIYSYFTDYEDEDTKKQKVQKNLL